MSYAPFETMLGVDEHQLAQRRRLMTSALLAATVCFGAGTVTWVGDKLGVAAVSPPKALYEISVEMFNPPPPTPKPPALPGKAVQVDDDTPVTPIPEEPDVAPDDVVPLDLDRDPKPVPTRTGVPGPNGGASGGVPGVGLGGAPGAGIGPGCLLPPCALSPIPRPPPPVDRPEPPASAPLKSVMARAIFSPDPNPRKLAQTPTGRGGGQAGKASVAFCINPEGKTYNVRMAGRFPGDPQVDEICRKTVRSWRFRPLRVDGRARSTCTSVSFQIHFD